MNKELWCSARKVQNITELENKSAVDMAVFVAAQTIPYAGEAFTVIELLGVGEEEEGDVTVSLDSFETTASDLPAYLLTLPEGKNTPFRILDTTELTIESVSAVSNRAEYIMLAGRRFSCRVFSVTAKHRQETFWIAEDHLGAFMVKEKGTDADGPYEMKLQQYNTDNL